MIEREQHIDDALVERLESWAADYAAKSDGVMEVLHYDPEHPNQYPGQVGISVEGTVMDGPMVDTIAVAAQPLYPELRAALAKNEKEIDMVGELLRGGNSVIMATNHGDLIDIAVTHAALFSNLEHRGFKIHDTNVEDDGYRAQTGIIISKMVAFLAYRLEGLDPAPCTEVLKILENETYLSIPKTESSRNRLLDRVLPRLVKDHNVKMRDAVKHKMGEGSLLLALAASGTTDKPKADDPTTIAMETIGTGTIDFMQQPDTYVAPIAVWYKSGQPIMEFADVPRVIRTEEEAHRMMGRIATTLSTKVPDLTFAYQTA